MVMVSKDMFPSDYMMEEVIEGIRILSRILLRGGKTSILDPAVEERRAWHASNRMLPTV